MLPLKSSHGKHLVYHPASVWKLFILDVVRVDRRSVETTDPLHGGIEMIKSMLLNQGRDLGRDSIKGLGLIDKNCPVRFYNRINNGFQIERPDRAEVQNLGRDVVVFVKGVRCFEAVQDRSPMRDKAYITSLSFDISLAKWD